MEGAWTEEFIHEHKLTTLDLLISHSCKIITTYQLGVRTLQESLKQRPCRIHRVIARSIRQGRGYIGELYQLQTQAI